MRYLSLLSFLGLRVFLIEGELHFYPKEKLTPKILLFIKEHKAEIVKELGMNSIEGRYV